MNSKKGVIPVCLISIFVLINFVSCNKDKDDSEEMIVTIASVKKILSFQTWLGCYWMKVEGSSEWTDGWDITGFEHKDGHEYKLRILSEKWPDDIQTLLPVSPIYTLLEILYDQEKESEGIPVQYLLVSIASKKSESGNYYVSFGHHYEEVGEIIDFDYEEGYEYRIEVSARFLGQYAQPRYKYTCQKILMKEEMDTEWLPESDI